MKIAILGWGSLLWDKNPTFDEQHHDWKYNGPELRLEFSRISGTIDPPKGRLGALTLVIDNENGSPCRVAYTISKRNDPADAISDLRCREGTILKRIGYWYADRSNECVPDIPDGLVDWAQKMALDAVMWTGLESNFQKETNNQFSTETALEHLQGLSVEAKAKAAEYIWLSPDFVKTPLRTALEGHPWFAMREAQPDE